MAERAPTGLEVRANFKKSDDIRDAGLTTPQDVIRYNDIPYGPEPAWQSLDVYRPRAAAGELLPVIVSVHGGGWVYGDKERYQYYCMSLAQRGFAVVNFTYRLAPEHQFPAHLEDVNAVFSWAQDHGAEFKMDTDHVFAVGDSAGAHLLGLFTALCTDSKYAAQFAFRPRPGFKPTAIALNCGTYKIAFSRDPEVPDGTRELMAALLPGKGTPEELKKINVLSHINSHFPPVFLMTAVGDFLQPAALDCAKALSKCNVPFLYRLYGSAEKPLYHVFHCNMRQPEGTACNDDECNFFKSFL